MLEPLFLPEAHQVTCLSTSSHLLEHINDVLKDIIDLLVDIKNVNKHIIDVLVHVNLLQLG